jgi:hypothetical protein
MHSAAHSKAERQEEGSGIGIKESQVARLNSHIGPLGRMTFIIPETMQFF